MWNLKLTSGSNRLYTLLNMHTTNMQNFCSTARVHLQT